MGPSWGEFYDNDEYGEFYECGEFYDNDNGEYGEFYDNDNGEFYDNDEYGEFFERGDGECCEECYESTSWTT